MLPPPSTLSKDFEGACLFQENYTLHYYHAAPSSCNIIKMAPTNKGTPNSQLTTEERKEKRRAANRKSARKSRYRETVMLDELQRHSRELSERNNTLKESNKNIRQAIVAIKAAKDTEKKNPRQVSSSRRISK